MLFRGWCCLGWCCLELGSVWEGYYTWMVLSRGVVLSIAGSDIITSPQPGQTNRCKNITLPQTSFVGEIMTNFNVLQDKAMKSHTEVQCKFELFILIQMKRKLKHTFFPLTKNVRDGEQVFFSSVLLLMLTQRCE